MPDHWDVLERYELLDASPWLKVIAETVRLEDGERVISNYYRIESPSFVMMFVVTVDQKVAIIEQYKHGIGQRVIELPAGYIEPGEEPLISAKRELLEETGLEAPDWLPLGSFTVDGNRGCGKAYSFLVWNAYQVREPEPGDLENQTLHFYAIEQVREIWLRGGMPSLAPTAVTGLALAHWEKQSAG
jgi:ADP-ribose pyrophosphatase